MQPAAGAIQIAQSLNFVDEAATTGMRDAWEAEMGYRPVGGPNVVDLLWDQLTDGSDPTGQSGPKPLMPSTDGFLHLFVGGHSEVKREHFRWGIHPHTNRVRDVLRRQFAEQHERHQEHARKVLDFWCEKYRVEDWKEFVPANLHAHVPGRLKHQTTITDDFTRADGDTIGNQLSWTEVGCDWDTVGNLASKTATNSVVEHARAESALSSDDHYAQILRVSTVDNSDYQGPCARIPASPSTDKTFYTLWSDGASYLTKFVTGTQTVIATGSRAVASEIYKVQADGSTIKGFYAGAEALSVTDTAITGNLHCGINAFGSGATLDDFEAADLAAGGGFIPYPRPRGLVAGMSVMSGGF